MISIKLLRDNPSAVRQSEKKRGRDVSRVDEALELDRRWRETLQEASDLRHTRNTISKEIARYKQEGEEEKAEAAIARMQSVNDEIAALEEKEAEMKEQRDACLWRIGNILHDDVPEGEDEHDNVEIRTHGAKPDFSFEPKGHVDLMEGLGLLDYKTAGEVAASRLYYTKGDLVRMQRALADFTLDLLRNKGYTIIYPPVMLKEQHIKNATDFDGFKEDIFRIEGKQLDLISTAEHAILAYHSNNIFEEGELDEPVMYAGVSSCFRKEAGSHGKDTKGIFRVHQFEKVEQFIFCRPEESWELHEELTRYGEEVMQKLELPYRMVNVCTGDLGLIASKKYDLEAWFPSQNRYRELQSSSNCLAYQARRANIRYRDGNDTRYVHTLNNTAVAIQRTLCAIFENYQRADGSIAIPDVLQPYMGGQTEITA